MHVRKESGGTTITHRRVQYEWPEDGSVIEVPDELGADLLSIRGGGFSEAPEPVQSVTEPGPAAEITEPGPVADINEDGGSQAPGEGDATDPDGDGGTGPESDGGEPQQPGGPEPEVAKGARSRAKGKDAPEA